jgi:2'-5' RNA ligase
MPCATTLYFDLETDAAIRRLWQAIEDAGFPSAMLNLEFRPHLTLAVCETMDLDTLRGELPRLVAATHPLAVTFHSLGAFTVKEGVVYLGVTVTRDLLDLHDQLWKLLTANSTGNSSYYLPGIWVPHVTLGYGLPQEQVGSVINLLLKSPLPVIGMVTELVVTDVAGTGFVDLFASRLGSPVDE